MSTRREPSPRLVNLVAAAAADPIHGQHASPTQPLNGALMKLGKPAVDAMRSTSQDGAAVQPRPNTTGGIGQVGVKEGERVFHFTFISGKGACRQHRDSTSRGSAPTHRRAE